MADGACAVRLASFTIRREHGPAHVCFIRPNFESSDVYCMVFGDFAGKRPIVFEMCFKVASTGGVKCELSTIRVGCFALARPTQVVWVSWIYRNGVFADGAAGGLGSRRLGCHGIS
jgi:hypothetical protein